MKKPKENSNSTRTLVSFWSPNESGRVVTNMTNILRSI